MSQFRNISSDARFVVYGVTRPTEVAVDGIVTVDDDADDAYSHQTAIWKPAITPPAVKPTEAPVAPKEAAE